MAGELFIPKLGQTVEEVTLLKWLVRDGEKVKQGQEVLEVETDKAIFNVEAIENGYIHFGPYKAGQVVPILQVVAIIGEKDETFTIKENLLKEKDSTSGIDIKSSMSLPQNFERSPDKFDTHQQFSSPRARKLAKEKGINLNAITASGGGGIRIREVDVSAYLASTPKASPIAKKMASKAGLDLRNISASGKNGEISKADVELAVARRSNVSPNVDPEKKEAIILPKMEVSESIPLKGIRGIIAGRMSNSSRSTAPVTLFMEVDATDFVAFRENLKVMHQGEWGFAPGYNVLFAKICSFALHQFRYLNARLNDGKIEHLAKINIGIAVDDDKGLYVPVIRDLDKKDLRSIAVEFQLLVEKIRNGSISPDDLSGGTFTITNLGTYDIECFTPVINLPEAAILGVGIIAPKAVVKDDQIVIRQMLTLSLTFDHRLVDGAPAAKFLKYIKELIETPDKENLVY
jgi:pyruvate dehydrogenase E2 component (dihydrolipoamide acetyltransferase)